jgi:hypothetical protein
MKDIRNLLLDCRAALRRSDPGFGDTPLGEALDDAILGISRSLEPPPPSEVPAAKPHAQRIAYAWQAAARELRASHPEFHALLSKRVFERLGEAVLDDADDEIERLHARIEALSEENAALRAAPAPAPAAAGGTSAAAQDFAFAQPQAPAADPHVPSRELLQAVADGRARLSDGHRDWCIAEALVLTGFERTPVQLLEDGDAGLVALVLRGTAAA